MAWCCTLLLRTSLLSMALEPMEIVSCVWEVTVKARIMLSACASFRRAFHTQLSIYSHSSRKTTSMAPTDRQSVGSAAVVSLSSSALRRRHGRRIRLQWCSSGCERICTSSAAGRVALCHAAHCLQPYWLPPSSATTLNVSNHAPARLRLSRGMATVRETLCASTCRVVV